MVETTWVGRTPVTRLVIVGVFAALLLGSAGPSAAAVASAPVTTLHVYAPFAGGSIAPGIRVARTVSGYCWTSSIGDWRSDAFRCFVGNLIHDPCFANTVNRPSFVLCPLYRPGQKVLRINLTKPLPSRPVAGDPTRHAPWFIRLANGQWCGREEGATGLVAGLPISYGCTHGVLLGNPHRGHSWTMFFARNFTARQYKRVPITAVWW